MHKNPNKTGAFGSLILATVAAMLFCGSLSVSASTYDQQKAFSEMRFGMFIHFNMGTFHDAEWVLPGQDPLSFNPTNLDCAQWAAAAKAAGMKFAVLTTKHHDGFCLWPTAYTNYNVMNSSYKHDIVKLYVDAFRAAGVTPCLYFSIWDRNQGIAKGSVSQADLDFIKGQLTELLTNYGPIPLLVVDGWTWQMGHREASYQVIRETVKALQPNCLIVDHTGMTEPYEEDLINFEHFTVPSSNNYASTQGNSIMAKWFWHPGYDTANPMALSSIVSRLNTCESHYCNFLLNCPPGPTGQIGANIVNRIAQVPGAWTPNASRAPLPTQPDVLEHPVTPVSATATSGTAMNAIDGTTDWVSGAAVQTLWQSNSGLPQSVTMDLGSVWSPIDMLTYMPRADHTGDVTTAFITTWNITGYKIYVSTNGTTFTQVASGTWSSDKTIKRVHFSPVSARYVRLEATSANGATYAVINEFDVGSFTTKPTVGGGGNIAPTVSITSPTNGAAFTAGANITINATAADSDGAVSKVDFYQGSTLLGTDTASPYSFTWNGVAAGNYALTAKATDNGGATTTSSVVNITVTGGGGAVVVQSETGTWDSGGVLETINAGWTGTGYVNTGNAIGGFSEVTVNVATAGSYTINFRYANGGTADRPADLSINGTVVQAAVSFPGTGAWTTWSNVIVTKTLNAGNNTIRLTATTANGCANLDMVTVQ